MQDILTLQTLKIYHKFRNNKLPYYIQNWPLFQNSNIHNHNTRGANALHKNRCRGGGPILGMFFCIGHCVNPYH